MLDCFDPLRDGFSELALDSSKEMVLSLSRGAMMGIG